MDIKNKESAGGEAGIQIRAALRKTALRRAISLQAYRAFNKFKTHIMISNEFQIEFTYDEVSYVGLVVSTRQDGDIGYRVHLESDNQEIYLDLILMPSDSELEDWVFTCGNAENAKKYYDKGLLEEVGEQIEAYQIRRMV
jgi:hypothetical protein